MTERRAKVLVIGYGNPGRLDDGLGPAFAAAIEAMGLSDVTVDSDYQLTVEDAADVAKHDIVVFADASVSGDGAFECSAIVPESDPRLGFSSHSVSPATVLGLAKDLFNACVSGYVLAIRGYEFNEFGQALSEQARTNLSEAVEYFVAEMSAGQFSRVDEAKQTPAMGN